MFEKCFDRRLVALVKHPLADAPGGDEAGMVQDGEVGGDGGLRECASAVDLAGADAEFVGMIRNRPLATGSS
jgi:hypothetical protein